MTNNLKCPICGGNIEYNDSYSTYDCRNNSSEHYASKEIWQALIQAKQDLERTRKALDIAWDGLKKIGSGNIIEHSVVGHENDNKIFIANKALDESKTALEQKE